MALQMDVKSSTGLVIKNAYIKIVEYSCNKNNNVSALIRGYVNKELEFMGCSAIEGSDDIIEIVGGYLDNSPNTKKQIYEHMKLLERYQSAVDVLE